ncbi:hypothetical protein EST38_g4070 [Candolleomyces aberdarensis]|uniref:Uncharacterized protein n=1 Tax=Candolleomyces aberdarensis TaxID=2316362 RepID=A0A4Q2DRY8_9AGAR|nr:hypothetical protein EST38_g4070 [Candolleomyces aberdarensis]
MECVPVELWLYVFSIACSDDGRTGRSLSLVSRRVNQLSKPFKYQSIAVDKLSNIAGLSEILQNLPAEFRVVQKLFVHVPEFSPNGWDDKLGVEEDRMSTGSSDGNMEYDPQGPGQDQDASMSDSDEESVPEEVQAKADEQAIQDLQRLLTLVSPTLTILSVFWRSFEPMLIEEILPPLPHLQELCLFRTVMANTEELEPSTDEKVPTLLPSLTRLHLGGLREDRPMTFGQFIFDVSPSLRELRLSMHVIAEYVHPLFIYLSAAILMTSCIRQRLSGRPRILALAIHGDQSRTGGSAEHACSLFYASGDADPTPPIFRRQGSRKDFRS